MPDPEGTPRAWRAQSRDPVEAGQAGAPAPDDAGTGRADARVYATPAGVRLGPLDQIADGAARNFVLQLRAGRFHGFVVRQGDRVHGYVDRCPHAGVPMAQVLDDYLTDDGALIRCSWHGALFRIGDGRCVGGPCMGASLTPWPVAVLDGAIVTA